MLIIKDGKNFDFKTHSNKHEAFYTPKRSPVSTPRGKGDHLTNSKRFAKMREWRKRHQFAG